MYEGNIWRSVRRYQTEGWNICSGTNTWTNIWLNLSSKLDLDLLDLDACEALKQIVHYFLDNHKPYDFGELEQNVLEVSYFKNGLPPGSGDAFSSLKLGFSPPT